MMLSAYNKKCIENEATALLFKKFFDRNFEIVFSDSNSKKSISFEKFEVKIKNASKFFKNNKIKEGFLKQTREYKTYTISDKNKNNNNFDLFCTFFETLYELSSKILKKDIRLDKNKLSFLVEKTLQNIKDNDLNNIKSKIVSEKILINLAFDNKNNKDINPYIKRSYSTRQKGKNAVIKQLKEWAKEYSLNINSKSIEIGYLPDYCSNIFHKNELGEPD